VPPAPRPLSRRDRRDRPALPPVGGGPVADRARAPAAARREGPDRRRMLRTRRARPPRRPARKPGAPAAIECKEDLAAPRPPDRRTATRSSTPARRKLLDMWPKTRAAYAGDEYVVRSATRRSGPSSPQCRWSGSKIRRWRCRNSRTRARSALGSSGRTSPGASVHGGRVRVQAGQTRGPDADCRREGRPVPHQQAASTLADGMPAKRLSTALRLGVTLYGPKRSRPAAGHYGKVGNSGVSIRERWTT